MSPHSRRRARRIPLYLLLLLLASPLFAATPTVETGLCGIGGCGGCPSFGQPVPATEFWTAPGETVVIGVSKQTAGACPFPTVRTYTTATPSIVTVDWSSSDDRDELRVRGLTPGDGYVTSPALRIFFIIHVESCAEGLHSIKLLPAYSGTPGLITSITPETSGIFDRGMFWYVNGVFTNSGARLSFLVPANGVYTVTLRADSACGVIEANTFVFVGPQRGRGVRRR